MSWWSYCILFWLLSLQLCISCPFPEVFVMICFCCAVALKEPWKPEEAPISHYVENPSPMCIIGSAFLLSVPLSLWCQSFSCASFGWLWVQFCVFSQIPLFACLRGSLFRALSYHSWKQSSKSLRFNQAIIVRLANSRWVSNLVVCVAVPSQIHMYALTASIACGESAIPY